MSLADLPLPYAFERNYNGPVELTGITDHGLVLKGRTNHSVPCQHFADSIGASDDEQFVQTATEIIWLSAYASNNTRSDYHWQASACYYEAQRRGKPELYQQAYDEARKQAGV